MKPRHRRFALIAAGVAAFGIAVGLVLYALQGNVAFFYSPSQVAAGEAPRDRTFRVGGLVEAGSLKRRADGLTVEFVITDTAQRIAVVHTGILPDLFKEGRGAIAQGKLEQNGTFRAAEVLAKHDENYMPPEAAHAIEKANSAKGGTDTGAKK